ncbi:hypothetical protein H1P_3820001 [Hyella patelloides LEGE 07179]|uniref:Uncharacterized protein n=1 Tax=Hyella patelloides LEGE 07179 TaxID=945734 RepID=A0A563VWR2_9CYAN|nr:hypothetical protein [Hyella patelloides]VEP15894.1 hypothetical protein H1P_3820001 [Hyella patelloides LEGE 07179]
MTEEGYIDVEQRKEMNWNDYSYWRSQKSGLQVVKDRIVYE